MQDASVSSMLGGGATLIVLILAVVLTLFWIFFPLLVYAELRRLNRTLELLNRTADKHGAQLQINTAATELNTRKTSEFFEGRNVEVGQPRA